MLRYQNTQYSLHASISPNSSFEPVELDDVVENDADGWVACFEPDERDAGGYMIGYLCGSRPEHSRSLSCIGKEIKHFRHETIAIDLLLVAMAITPTCLKQ